jgi:hypothetical protein
VSLCVFRAPLHTIRKTPFIREALNELINVSSLARIILPVSAVLKEKCKVGAVMITINRLPASELRIRKKI